MPPRLTDLQSIAVQADKTSTEDVTHFWSMESRNKAQRDNRVRGKSWRQLMLRKSSLTSVMSLYKTQQNSCATCTLHRPKPIYKDFRELNLDLKPYKLQSNS